MASQHQATILLVEDDPGVARLEQLRLERAGFAVVTATTAEEGLEHIGNGRIDLIILDQRLSSGTSGLEFFRRVKERGHNVPAILVTGLHEENLLVEALRAGVRDFVPKTPNFLNHLEPIVNRVLDQVRTEHELAESRLLAREQEVRRRELEHEVAHRKRVEQALREAEEYLRLMVESVKDFAIFTVDPQGLVVTWNPGAERLFGYPEKEILGQQLATLFTPEDRAAGVPEQEIATAAAKGRSSDERWHQCKDGGRFFASGVLAPIFDEENKLRGFTKIARDITERKEAEEAVREAAVRLKAIVETAVDGIITIDERGLIESINPAAERIFDYTHDEVVGRNIAMLMSDPERGQHDHYLHDYLRTGRQKIIGTIREVRGLRKDKSVFPMELAVSETRLGTRRIFTGIVRDITEYQRIVEALKDADQRKDQFLAMLAHELRNPLAPISNAVQIMQLEGPNGPSFQWSTEVIADQIKHMTRMVDDLLDVSRITRGKVDLQKETITLADVVDLAFEASRPTIDAYRHQLSVVLPDEPIVLEVDPPRLAQVLSNLLNNAAKYTDEGGQISLTAEKLDHEVVIRVRDSGIGIAPEILPKVFELFTQADQTLSRSRGGLGIGLTLVRSLVEMHNGRVTAHSAGLGQGSEFLVRLPLARHSNSGTAAVTDINPQMDEELPRRRILVVDDNRSNAQSLDLLLRALGQEVYLAFEGSEAILLAQKHRPEVILLDIGLPVMDGYEVARRCRENARFDGLTLVAMTGYGQESDRLRSQEAGFDAHLVKPVKLDQLRLLLKQSGRVSSTDSTRFIPQCPSP
jgi:PAS domain S-box-containing protein